MVLISMIIIHMQYHLICLLIIHTFYSINYIFRPFADIFFLLFSFVLMIPKDCVHIYLLIQ